MDKTSITRRAFLAVATTSAMACRSEVQVNTARVVPGKLSPNEKMNIAGIGVGGMGAHNIEIASTENIVALCDVDDDYAGKTFAKYQDAKRFKDFRRMFDAEEKNIDGVIIATPDHTHAVLCMAAIGRGKHVYCQKPLAHSVHEVRTIMAAAKAAGVQTQMGNQGHSSTSIKRMRDWFRAGAIGEVREVHAWSDRPVGGDPWSDFPIMKRPEDTPPVPPRLDWDLWLGPAPARPYHPIYHPSTWRGFWDFGTGALGDMGCHILDPAFWALELGAPESVEATTTHWEPEVMSETYPRAAIVRYAFPARGAMPPVKLTWYDGRMLPPVPRDFAPGQTFGGNGALIIGDKGTMLHGSHGAGGLTLLPESLGESFVAPEENYPEMNAGAHEQDWIRACKDGVPACSNFEYGGALTEMVLLGVLAMRVKDRRLNYDAATHTFTNSDEANALLNPPYREGWSL